MKNFGLPQCPYCERKINPFYAWYLRTQGEYICPSCKGVSNITISPVAKVLGVAAVIAGILVFAVALLDQETDFPIFYALWIMVPFALFSILSAFCVQLKKPILRKRTAPAGQRPAGQQRPGAAGQRPQARAGSGRPGAGASAQPRPAQPSPASHASAGAGTPVSGGTRPPASGQAAPRVIRPQGGQTAQGGSGYASRPEQTQQFPIQSARPAQRPAAAPTQAAAQRPAQSPASSQQTAAQRPAQSSPYSAQQAQPRVIRPSAGTGTAQSGGSGYASRTAGTQRAETPQNPPKDDISWLTWDLEDPDGGKR